MVLQTLRFICIGDSLYCQFFHTNSMPAFFSSEAGLRSLQPWNVMSAPDLVLASIAACPEHTNGSNYSHFQETIFEKSLDMFSHLETMKIILSREIEPFLVVCSTPFMLLPASHRNDHLNCLLAITLMGTIDLDRRHRNNWSWSWPFH